MGEVRGCLCTDFEPRTKLFSARGVGLKGMGWWNVLVLFNANGRVGWGGVGWGWVLYLSHYCSFVWVHDLILVLQIGQNFTIDYRFSDTY